MSNMKDWNQDQMIDWIKSLPTDDRFSETIKQEIIDGIKKYAKDNNSAVTGEDFEDAESAEDVAEITGTAKRKAKLLLKQINKYKDDQVNKKLKEKGAEPGSQTGTGSNDTFTLNVIGQQGKAIPLEGVTANMKVKEIKALYLENEGNQTAADSYRGIHKWDSNKGKISLKLVGKSMDNEQTLGSYGIFNGLGMPPVVGFHVIGGSKYDEFKESKDNEEEEEEDEDEFRTRKLRIKKYQGMIKLSPKPDCIMGYTDSDGIKRAEMTCGCAISADTMWRYLKSLFEKDFKSTKLFCPTPEKECKGGAKQREWNWSLIFAVADLSPKEIAKYTRIINNRLTGSKSCPHCNASTERPKDLRIWRVRCVQCNKSDWCWNCLNVWKASGLGPICGNKHCMGSQINKILANCDRLKPEWSDIQNRNEKVPQVRACPKCCTTLEYSRACKHMWCLCCPHEFCFNCLRKWKDECSHLQNCATAKIQVF